MVAGVLVSGILAFSQTEGPLKPRRRPGRMPPVTDDAPATLTRRTRTEAAPLIDRARDVNSEFTESLPNFIANQRVERFVSFDQGRIWAIEDIVEAEVLYVDHEESYRSIRINGRRPVDSMEDLERTSSTGEYGTILRNLFAPQLGLEFARTSARDNDVSGAIAYATQASKEQSTWSINFNAATVRPAFRATVWLAPESGRALRIEMLTDSELPTKFGLQLVRTTLRFASLMISGAEYLLPASSTTLTCVRRSANCFRHDITFSNYRKFAAESSIFQTDSDVSFGDEVGEETPTR